MAHASDVFVGICLELVLWREETYNAFPRCQAMLRADFASAWVGVQLVGPGMRGHEDSCLCASYTHDFASPQCFILWSSPYGDYGQ
jgi:hypothetical protein